MADCSLTPALQPIYVSAVPALFNQPCRYNQIEVMCRCYRSPILLIEFDSSRAFAMNSASDITSEISNSSIISKISLLCIHFPALRILWSRDPDMTADMFYELKQLSNEPEEAAAISAGV
jgi:DNA excision repair protein ERCC-4